ncbi:MAG: SHOCT domain-containing protein [Rectinemataceae bacterium]
MFHAWNGVGYGFGFPWGGFVMGFLFIALVALVIVAIVRMGKTERLRAGNPKERGLEILTERFARGEIDAETFRAMKNELEVKK